MLERSAGIEGRPGGERHHALDALRGIAMMLGIVLHGAVAYMADPLPELLWPAMDRARSPMFDMLFWWIHSFRIPLFFLIAGFFAMRLHDARGARGFIANRIRRVGLPFLLAGLIILPLTYYIWCLGWLVTGRCTLDEILAWKFADPLIQQNFKGPAHLWFLEYLLIVYAGFVVVRAIMNRGRGHAARSECGADRAAQEKGTCGHLIDAALFSPLRPLIFSLPTALILALDPAVFTGFRNTFAPSPAGLAYYGVFFAAGCAMYPAANRLADLTRGGWIYLLATIPLLALALHLMNRAEISGFAHDSLAGRAMLAITVSLLAWMGVFGSLGVFLRLFSAERPALRFIADASYWVYLVHLPIVGGLHVALLAVALPAAVKFVTVVLAAISVTLWSYHALVRGTMMGRLLGGHRAMMSENRARGDVHRGRTRAPAPETLQISAGVAANHVPR